MIFSVRLEDGADKKRVVMATYLSKRIEWSRFAYSSKRIRKGEDQRKCGLIIYLFDQWP